MSFQAVRPEASKECSPNLVVQDCGTSSLCQLNIIRGRPGQRSVTCRSVTGSRVPDRADTCMSADITWTWHAAGNSTSGACHAWLLILEHNQAGRVQVKRPHVKLTVDVTFGQQVDQQADCCSSLDGCESLLEQQREQHSWSEIVEPINRGDGLKLGLVIFLMRKVLMTVFGWSLLCSCTRTKRFNPLILVFKMSPWSLQQDWLTIFSMSTTYVVWNVRKVTTYSTFQCYLLTSCSWATWININICSTDIARSGFYTGRYASFLKMSYSAVEFQSNGSRTAVESQSNIKPGYSCITISPQP